MRKILASIVVLLLASAAHAAPRTAVRVVTHVVNDDGGAAIASDWLANGAPGSETGVTFELKQGQTYDIRSSVMVGYVTSSAGCLFKAKPGVIYLCQFTHDDVYAPPAGTLPDCGQPTLQAAIDAAVDGDVIRLPEGRCVWDTNVSLANKHVSIIGAGIDKTVIERNGPWVFYTYYDVPQKARFRISGMTLTGSTSGALIGIAASRAYGSTQTGWRVDHMKFDYPSGQRTGIFVSGPAYGVLDHNEFIWAGGAAMLNLGALDNECSTAYTPAGDFIATQPLDLGTENAIYLEDNRYISNGVNPINVYDVEGGGRAVFRHNYVEGGFYYSHWTRGCGIGGVLHEVYNNRWVSNDAYRAYPVRLEAGTGVVFNNAMDDWNAPAAPFIVLDERRGGPSAIEMQLPMGACDGSQPHDGNLGDPAAPGWPCYGQIGRAPGKSYVDILAGDKQTSAPVYIWNNGIEATCATGGECNDVLDIWAWPAEYVRRTPHPNGDVDYVVGLPLPGYVPLVYPHPLVN